MTGVDPPCHWHDNRVPGGRAEANPGLSVAWPVQRLPIPPLPGGALDGIKEPKQCFVICGGGRWRITSSAGGTCSGPFRQLRSRAPAALALVTLAAVHWFHECWPGDHAACSRHPSRDCRLRGRCSGGKAGSGDKQLCTRCRASWPVDRGQGAVGQDDDFRRGTTGRALARQPGITWPGHSAHPRRRQDVPTGLVRAIPAGRQAEFGAAGATRTLAWAIAGSTENKLPDSRERRLSRQTPGR